MKRKWTQEEREILIEQYPHTDTKSIAATLGRTDKAVYQQAIIYNLKKSAEYLNTINSGRHNLINAGVAYRFKKGLIPANKGKRMSKAIYEKCAKTMFKKGNVPHNTNYDGHERISKDGVIEVRVKLGVYVAKHRLIWEKENGAVPNGHIVVFKDKNPLNCTLDNLEIITRQENMRRNTVHRYPPELKHVMKLTKKLERRIKNHEEQNNRPAQSSI